MDMQKRLLGTWRSDRAQTLRLLHPYHELPTAKKRKVASIFGKLTLRYTPRYIYATLDGTTTRERYSVVAEDRWSIVLKVHHDQERKRLEGILGPAWDFSPTLAHVTIDMIGRTPCYWVKAGRIQECFRKIR